MMVANMSTVTSMVERGKNITLNVPEYMDGFFFYFTVFIQILYIVIVLSGLGGLMGNMKVIWILRFYIKRSPFATYILNLAVADFGTLLSDLAYEINLALVFFNNTFHGGFDIIFSLADVLIFFTHSASLYLLTAVSLETVLSVLFPVWYRCHRPGRSSAVVSFLLWILSGLLSGILLLCHLQGVYCGTIVNIICIVKFSICTLLMMASGLTVMIAVCCNARRRRPPRLYMAILVTILVFILFGLPQSGLHLFFSDADDFPLEAMESSYLLASFISSIRPLIYYLGGRDRKRRPRESLKIVLQRLFKEEAEAREEMGNDHRQKRVRLGLPALGLETPGYFGGGAGSGQDLGWGGTSVEYNATESTLQSSHFLQGKLISVV